MAKPSATSDSATEEQSALKRVGIGADVGWQDMVPAFAPALCQTTVQLIYLEMSNKTISES